MLKVQIPEITYRREHDGWWICDGGIAVEWIRGLRKPSWEYSKAAVSRFRTVWCPMCFSLRSECACSQEVPHVS